MIWRGALVALLCGASAVVRAAGDPGLQRMAEAQRLLDAWQLEEARQLTEALLYAHPHNPEVQTLAAQVLHQQGEHVAALSLLRHVEPAPPQPARSSLRALVSASAAYAPAFARRDTAHFSLRYLDKDAVLAAYAGDVLEQAQARIGADLGFAPKADAEKIVVEIYPDARGLAGATGLTVKEIETSGTIAVCKFHRIMITSPLATFEGYPWADTLAHEFTHLLISKKTKNTIPVWLHEGIAKYYESRWTKDAGANLSPYSENLLAAAVRRHKLIGLAQMHPSVALLPSQEAAALAFAEVFTLVEFIVQRAGNTAVAQILQRCGEGKPLEVAVPQVLGLDLPALERAWRAALQARRFTPHPEAMPATLHLRDGDSDAEQDTAPAAPPADAGVHAATRLGELLQLRGHTAAAMVEYAGALQAAKPPPAQLVIPASRALADLQRYAEARTLLEELLRRQPDEVDAQLLAGRMCAQLGELAAAQDHFALVRLHNPYVPELHAALAWLHDKRGEADAAAAERALQGLCMAPRQRRDFAPPPALPPGASAASFVAPTWGPFTLDETPQRTPLWDMPLALGAHIARVAGPAQTPPPRRFALRDGEQRLVCLP